MTLTARRPVGVALLGAAHMPHAWSYVRAVTASEGLHLVGAHDSETEHLRWIRQDFGAPVWTDAEALVADPRVEAVVVCSATADHRAHVELAARHGRHVLCEKPVATTLADAEAVVVACRGAGVQLHLAFASRFLPLVVRAREAVRGGAVGDVVGVVGHNRGRPPLPPSYPAWITDPVTAGGGALLDHSVHVVDAMRHVTGLEVAEVSAEAGELLWGAGVDDVAVLSLRFAGGAVGSVDPSWSLPADHPYDYDFGLRVVGTSGSLDVTDDAEHVRLVATGDPHARGLRHVGFAEDPDRAMLEAFGASARSGEVLAPCATGEDGLRALEVALAGYRSATAGAPVDVVRERPTAP